MKRTLLEKMPAAPWEIARLLEGGEWYDSSSSPEARVFFVDKGEGLFLKKGKKGSLAREARMGEYFAKKGLSPAVLSYLSEEEDWLLTENARGEDATARVHLEDPRRLAAVLGEALRALHETEAEDCPVCDRMGEFCRTAEENRKRGYGDLTLFGEDLFPSLDAAYAVYSERKHLFQNEVLIHGDYCLPNVILDGFRVSAFIDLGNGGIGDRHVDLFWGAWTLWFNLKTNAYKERFFDAYGREKIEEERLLAVAAAEVFG
jgi:kanamycin kinase